jgi:hypothetical protein
MFWPESTDRHLLFADNCPSQDVHMVQRPPDPITIGKKLGPHRSFLHLFLSDDFVFG